MQSMFEIETPHQESITTLRARLFLLYEDDIDRWDCSDAISNR